MIIKDNNLKPEKEIVGCHIFYNGMLLCVKRNPLKPQGGKWGSIAGKKEKGESDLDAIVREIKEESGINVNRKDLKYIKTWKVVFDSPKDGVQYKSFSYSLYNINLCSEPDVSLKEDELVEYGWFTPKEALRLPLVEDEDNVLKEIFNL